MFCSVRERLLKEYHAAVRDFTDRVEKLKNTEGGEFARRLADSERARLICEEARRALDWHVGDHNCAGDADDKQ